jgi:S-adenosyl methyltransferase
MARTAMTVLRLVAYPAEGLPTAGNTHEIAQGVAPECRVVYVDNDPAVLVHARALLTSDPAGVTSYIDADARDPDTIVSQAGATLDLGQPVAIMMVDLLNFIDDEAADSILSRLTAAVVPGSYLAIMHQASDLDPARPETLESARRPAGEAALPRGHDPLPGGSRAGGAGPGDGARVAAGGGRGAAPPR